MAAGVLLCAVAGCGTATHKDDLDEASRQAALTQTLDAVVRAGVPGAQIVITEHGKDWVTTAGVGDLVTGARFPDDGRVRIGSNTKTFIATIVLQLVADGKVDLDAPIERYLPGIMQGTGHGGITIRNLLQHTSGLTDYTELPDLPLDSEEVRWQRMDTADLLRRVLGSPPRFSPGSKGEYSNTNYLLAGMLIEQVTGQPVDVEINRRIIEPLELQATYYPKPGETGLRGPHPRGYHERGGQRIDYTDLDTSWAGSAGAMVASGADLNRFFTALLGGKLLPAAQLAEMQKVTVPLVNRENIPYGLGLVRIAVPCDVAVWGHGGGIMGFRTLAGVTAAGRAVTVTATQLVATTEGSAALRAAFNAATCG
ncbi:serine hydrolase [Nocardia sp. XZ_19_385]|uniref:serine hydrolase domain-containing protein n=1 Tax=Nocardia sp. XZ_19_385 TaxID=2769488 RepID=UPI00188EB702|nr:serine hydrolase domain-containing protein [Nocardia sp. XZ_19_385]